MGANVDNISSEISSFPHFLGCLRSEPLATHEEIRKSAPLAKVSGLGCLLCQVPKNAPAALRRGHGGMARQCTSGALTPLPGGRGETQCSFPIHGTSFILLTPLAFRKTDKFKKLEMSKKQKTPKNAKCRKNRKIKKI